MRKLVVAAFAATSFASVGVAEAQDMSVMVDLQKNCMADAKTVCSKEMSKPQQLMQCLVNNQSKLSPNCQAASGRMAKTLGLKPTASSN
ncbi:hypothetical protein [Novosphingobium sp.]|uniref:hypothetical protein n=1 Tax=Novosphingobium sp. TaxID=1874826 RepID=UPI0026230BD2|nr:hypothetical protein [Novosphingobium sp.]